MSQYFDRIGEELSFATERRYGSGTEPAHTSTGFVRWPIGADSRRGKARLRRSTRRLGGSAVVAAILVGGATGALAATGIFQLGNPVTVRADVPRPTPVSGSGVVQHAATLFVASDPAGGLPWGMRLATTDRGVGCLAVARYQRGRLGALGQDGAFHDDGEFHPLPASVSAASDQCALLGRAGQLVYNVSLTDVPASGLDSSGVPVAFSCAPSSLRGPRDAHKCRQDDERNLYFGVLGPDATSLTYTAGGTTHSLRLRTSDGAYLIVLRASDNEAFSSTGAVSPSPPITSITYRHGLRCVLSGAREATHIKSCHLPLGYAHERRTPPARVRRATATAHISLESATRTTRDPRSPAIRATALQYARARWEIVVSFTATTQITSAHTDYTVLLRRLAGNKLRFLWTSDQNVRRGTRVTATFRSAALDFAAGTYRGAVDFNVLNLASPPPHGPDEIPLPGGLEILNGDAPTDLGATGTSLGNFTITVP